MNLRRRLLWIDGLAGAVVGVAMFVFGSWLAEWYQLPRHLLILMGTANLVYASFSLSLASRRQRPALLIRLLVIANLMWAVMCFRWALVFAESASFWGLAHLVGEGIFVAGLASLEWRWRELLRTA